MVSLIFAGSYNRWNVNELYKNWPTTRFLDSDVQVSNKGRELEVGSP